LGPRGNRDKGSGLTLQAAGNRLRSGFGGKQEENNRGDAEIAEKKGSVRNFV